MLAGVQFGAHTWSHPNLARLEGEALREQLERPLRWIGDSGLPMIRYLAYPYGLSSPAVAVAAQEAGYDGGLLVEGGWLRGAGYDRFAIPRYNVPAGLTLDGLRLRMSGLLSS